MNERVEIRNGREFVIKTLPPDWRLSPSAARRRAQRADLMKRCPSCGRKVVPWQEAKVSGGRASCGECARYRADRKAVMSLTKKT